MWKNNKLLFADNYKVTEAKVLKKEYEKAMTQNRNEKANEIYQEICTKIKKRVDHYYFKPIEKFLEATVSCKERENFGFIVMTVNCILIEFYYEMIMGIDMSSDKISNETGRIEYSSVKKAYLTVLPELDSEILESEAEIFYKGIRCGIIHQGQTKENTAITFESGTIIKQNNPYYFCNPEILFNKLKECYQEYWDMMKQKDCSDDESKKLIKKFGFILAHID